MHAVPLQRPNLALVDKLEYLLAEARAGRLLSLVFAGEIAGGEMTQGYSEMEDRYALIGALEALKFLLMEDIAGDARGIDPPSA